MGRKGIKQIIMLLVIVVFFSVPASSPYHAHHEPLNIVILNSYHRGLAWTEEQTEGILEAPESLEWEYNVSIEYMDWKNYPSEHNLHGYNEPVADGSDHPNWENHAAVCRS